MHVSPGVHAVSDAEPDVDVVSGVHAVSDDVPHVDAGSHVHAGPDLHADSDAESHVHVGPDLHPGPDAEPHVHPDPDPHVGPYLEPHRCTADLTAPDSEVERTKRTPARIGPGSSRCLMGAPMPAGLGAAPGKRSAVPEAVVCIEHRAGSRPNSRHCPANLNGQITPSDCCSPHTWGCTARVWGCTAWRPPRRWASRRPSRTHSAASPEGRPAGPGCPHHCPRRSAAGPLIEIGVLAVLGRAATGRVSGIRTRGQVVTHWPIAKVNIRRGAVLTGVMALCAAALATLPENAAGYDCPKDRLCLYSTADGSGGSADDVQIYALAGDKQTGQPGNEDAQSYEAWNDRTKSVYNCTGHACTWIPRTAVDLAREGELGMPGFPAHRGLRRRCRRRDCPTGQRGPRPADGRRCAAPRPPAADPPGPLAGARRLLGGHRYGGSGRSRLRRPRGGPGTEPGCHPSPHAHRARGIARRSRVGDGLDHRRGLRHAGQPQSVRRQRQSVRFRATSRCNGLAARGGNWCAVDAHPKRQWRGYAGRAGYATGYRTETLIEAAKGYEAVFAKVGYG
ncbi:peptidase inhibitor family I36 [Streptomyces sp. KS 21]|nr:peptidase inhibitor family I36 [Streptomyces sp. KS 21]